MSGNNGGNAADRSAMARALEKISDRSRGALHSVLKRTAFGRQIEHNFGLMYGSSVNRGAVRNPSAAYRAFRGGVDGRPKNNKAAAVGKTVLLRTMNGPELNILMCGVPFLIWAGVNAAAKTQAEAAAANTAATIVMPRKLGRIKREGQTLAKPLASAPYSADVQGLVTLLIQYGMKEATALSLVQGEFMGDDLADVFDEEDLKALFDFLDNEA